MGLRTVLFVGLFLFCSVGALTAPLLGILGYIAHYAIGPEHAWWAAPLSPLGIRYSLTLAVTTALGIFFNASKLRYGKHLFTLHEKLLFLFLGWVLLLHLFCQPATLYTLVDPPALKLAKITIFCMMLTHVVTEVRSLKPLFWTLVAVTGLLGIEAYFTNRSMFSSGRLEGIGGVDFGEANFLPAFIEAVLPLMGVLFLTARWPGRLLALAAGVFSVNAIILCRSRGAVVGLAIGVVTTIFLLPIVKRYRIKILTGLFIAALGGVYLMDTGFTSRISTLNREVSEMDRSSQSRLETWQLSVNMLSDHPLGVGPGRFFDFAGQYDARYAGRDAHNIYVRCFAELGIPGILLLLAIIGHAMLLLVRTMRRSYELPPEHRRDILLPCYGATIGLAMMLSVGLTVTLLYTEAMWWFLMLPVCMQRAADNLFADLEQESLTSQEEPLLSDVLPNELPPPKATST